MTSLSEVGDMERTSFTPGNWCSDEFGAHSRTRYSGACLAISRRGARKPSVERSSAASRWSRSPTANSLR